MLHGQEPSSAFNTESVISQDNTEWKPQVSCKSPEASPTPSENYASHDAPCHTFPAEDVSDLNANQSGPELSEELEERSQPGRNMGL